MLKEVGNREYLSPESTDDQSTFFSNDAVNLGGCALRHLHQQTGLSQLDCALITREALNNSALANELPPLLLTRVDSPQGELTFMSTFTTFGMPLDITMSSLRIEHLIPADAKTWEVMTKAYEQAQHSQ
ncbi:hypothetical protein SAMN03159391_02746 [Pseudomonas sp. NFACC37-1]|nr:hypothetical protein SAMN03159391_02746 [Pseudomonas sp. NFACC37-1]SFO37462.1 hypothetical protein SAMN03159304_03026 [Pseudomonas sp. NFACC24-1]